MSELLPIERHPWQPYIPPQPRLIMLGTFPPKRERWSMEFFYPNRINDMWRIVGHVFLGDRDALWDEAENAFSLERIKELLDCQGIALWDTAMAVRRLKDNASDKFLEIVEPIDLLSLLNAHPTIHVVVTTGEKATRVIADLAGCNLPRIGEPLNCRVGEFDFVLWRMPSSSRAYPMKLQDKAESYRRMFSAVGCNVKTRLDEK